VPKHLRDAHYTGAKDMGHGEGYIYPHGKENNFAVQNYMGVSKKYYSPVDSGYESKIRERIKYWDSLRNND
jgi:putative ATPase